MRAVCQRHQCVSATSMVPDFPLPVPVECLAIGASAIPVGFSQPDVLGSCTLPQMSLEDWARDQRHDSAISRVIDIVQTGKRLSFRSRRQEDREVQLMLRVMEQLIISNNVLYRKRMSQGEPFHQLVLPKRFRKSALESLHDAVGHMGTDRTLDLVRACFYCPRMAMEVSEKIRTCERCIRRKARAE